jgi:peptidase M28-like protein
MLSRLVSVTLLWLMAAGAMPPAAERLPASIDRAIQHITAAELRTHVAALASDRFAGRGIGHSGNRDAERYIAEALREAGVPPASTAYVQPVEVYEPRLGTHARVTIEGRGRPLVELSAGGDFLPLPLSSDSVATGPLLFVGHGISAPRLHHDDYDNTDARGAIVLALDGAPEALLRSDGLASEDAAELPTIDRKADDARAHGAAGLIVIRGYPGDRQYLWPDRSSIRSAAYRLYAAMRETPLAVAAISERAAGPIRRALDEGQVLRVTLNPDVVARPIVMDNILAIVEGRGSAADMVVVGAHLDHDGIDEAGRIYNGADDNASGTAAVLAMASAFARAAADGMRPARAVVFALWNGEEKGSLGAEYYVSHPVPARRIVANVNLDMIGRDEDIPDAADPRYRGFAKTGASQNTNVVHLLGYTYAPDLARMAEIANEVTHLTLKEDYDRDAQNLVRRSDNWPFLRHGVPAVFLTTGLHPEYHTPDDDTGRIDFAKLERIAELASRLVWMAADGEAPRFKAQ